MKVVYDRDRKAFYIIPVNAADRMILENDFNMKQAGDFLVMVRQDIIGSDKQLSHLEIGQFLYSQPLPLSAYDNSLLEADPQANEPDPRGNRGTKRSPSATAAQQRRAAVLDFLDLMPPGTGDVAMLPPGTNPPDPPGLMAKRR